MAPDITMNVMMAKDMPRAERRGNSIKMRELLGLPMRLMQ